MDIWYANAALDDAQLAILGIPLDETGTFLPGTHLGPERIRACSEAVESYSPFFELNLTECKVSDVGDMDLKIRESVSRKIALIKEKTLELVENRVKPLLIGGEHTLTLGAVQAALQTNSDLMVLQLDAHADLRNVGERGGKIAHDTVMRRTLEVLEPNSLIQVGVRSFSAAEIGVEDVPRFRIDDVQAIAQTLEKRPCWLTFDLDVLDSSLMPAVGNPEPNGASYMEVINLLLALKEANIVGADLVEFNPLAADFPAPCVVAANLVRELCCLLLD